MPSLKLAREQQLALVQVQPELEQELGQPELELGQPELGRGQPELVQQLELERLHHIGA
jgi:hypothetical protein